MITIPAPFSDRGILCRVPTSCSYPRTAAGRHGAGAHDPPLLRVSASRQPGRKRTADDAADMQPAPRAISGHTPGKRRHRAACRRSIPYVPCSTPAPVRSSRHSRDSGRAFWVFGASFSPHSTETISNVKSAIFLRYFNNSQPPRHV